MSFATSSVRCLVPLCLLCSAPAPFAGPGEWQRGSGAAWRELQVPAGNAGFTRMAAERTGINFINLLSSNRYITNSNILNGSGVAIGDFDSDGLPDIFFAGLDSPNALYRNLGQWRFSNVTERAGV